MSRLTVMMMICALPQLARAQQPDPVPPPEPEPVFEPAPAPEPEPEPEPDLDADPFAQPGPGPAEGPDSSGSPETGVGPDANVEPAPKQLPPTENDAVVSGKQSFMDTRLNFTLTNENVFAKPGETIPSVPGWRFGVPNSLGTLFFDNYDTRFSGYETLSHAVLYKRVEKGPWDVEGALNIRINDLAENNINLSDAGSYIRVAYAIRPKSEGYEQVSFTAFPTSSDRMRLGYSWRLSWGGSDEYRRSRESVPGFKVQYDRDNMYVFAGAKSAVVLDPDSAEVEAVLAFLGGAGVDINEMVRVEVNGGYFDRGNNELQDVVTEKVRLYGVSAQVAVHKNEPVGSSIDYKLYRNDPERFGSLFRTATYPGGLSWLVKAEATYLGQTLKDPAVSGGTIVQPALAADINARVKYDRTRLRLDLSFRDLAFILHATPSLPTFSDFPEEYELGSNLFAALGADHNFEGTGVTIGAIVGIDKPATLETPTGGIPGDTVPGSGRSVAVIRNEGDITVLPQGESAVPMLATKLTGRVDFAEFFAALVDVYFVLDQNQTRLTREDENDLFTREFGEDRQLGFNLTLQAKF